MSGKCHVHLRTFWRRLLQGLRTLVVLASGGYRPPNAMHRRLPRKLDVGDFSWSLSDWQFIQRMQDMLREFSPRLVELRTLAPRRLR